MRCDDVCSADNDTAHRGGTSVAIVALALILTACGSEAENTDAQSGQDMAGTSQSATTGSDNATTGNAPDTGGNAAATGTSETSAGATTDGAADSDKTMMADSSDASQSGGDGDTQKMAAKEEEKKEEKKREPMDGYTVYNRFCQICHKQGMNGAPKFRNKQAWAPRIAKGKETLYKHSIEGFKAMPPKGGIAGLYDQEVKDAVDYMVENAGGWESAE